MVNRVKTNAIYKALLKEAVTDIKAEIKQQYIFLKPILKQVKKKRKTEYERAYIAVLAIGGLGLIKEIEELKRQLNVIQKIIKR